MQKSFQQQLVAMGENNVTLPSEDFEAYINKAVDAFVRSKFDDELNRERIGFEQSLQRVEDLRTLITTSELEGSYVTQNLISSYEADSADIPNNCLIPLSVSLKIYYDDSGIEYTVNAGKREPDGSLNTDYGEKRIPAKFVQHNDILSLLGDPFNSPSWSMGLFTVDNDKIYSYTDDKFITDKIVLTYLKQPREVSLTNDTDCDLAEGAHQEVVDLAVGLIRQDRGIQSPEAEASNN